MKSKLVVSLFAISSAVSIAGCGGSTGTSTNSTTVDGTNKAEYSSDAVTLPDGPTKFAWDLNGDGVADDRLGALIGALAITATAGSATPQSTTTADVQSGKLLFLFEETSTDSTQQSAKNVGVQFWLGTQPATPPKYDGTDTFTTMGGATQFYGSITAGTFTSDDPAHVTVPVTTTLTIALLAGPAITLPLTAARLTFTRGSDGKITGGQINGAVKNSDLMASVIPTVAADITTVLQGDGGASDTTLAGFDTNHDGTVSAVEIEDNPTISAFLKPDVQLFDAAGNYKPNPDNTTKDSLSIGLGFTGVGATFAD